MDFTFTPAEEAFRRRETLRHVYEALERESEVLRLLREAAVGGAMRVTIGHENRLPEMWEASVVAAPYGAGAGTIGIVGRSSRCDMGACTC